MTNTLNNTSSVINKQRFEVLDIAKGIGILFVVYAHVNYTPFLLSYIYSFHMPIFFMFSGMLFNKDKYDSFLSFVKRRAKTLICPYVLFYILSLLIMFPLYVVSEGLSKELVQDFEGYFLQMFVSQGSQKVINAPLWFVPCLFAVEIMYCFISKIRGIRNIHILLICFVLTFCGWLLESGILPFDNTILPWSIDSALFALGFYAIGNVFFDKVKYYVKKTQQNKYKNLIAVLVTVLCIVLLIPFVYLNGKISLGSKILNNGFLIYLSGIIGVVGVISAAILFEKSKFLKFCGLNSFCIMSTHVIIRLVYQAFYSFAGITLYDSTSFVQTLIPFVAVLVASIVFAFLYSKTKNMLIKS